MDKTGLIAVTNKYVNTLQQYLCVSRPRRFGKSVALYMLAAYYSRGCDSEELFHGFQIEKAETFREHLNQYEVIFLNMQQFLIRTKMQEVTEYLEQAVMEEIREEYGELLSERITGLAEALERIYARTGRQFIFLIDEWDCVMRERQESGEMQKQYLDFLRNLLKDQEYVALAYMTGILPVKKYGIHSALNMFKEYSMTDQFDLEEYTGFTQEEVKELCGRYDMDFVQTGSWYDGYQFRRSGHIYNPRSVVMAMQNRAFSNYWTTTETYEALKIYMDMDFDGLRTDVVHMLGGGRVKVNTYSFRNDMRNLENKDDVLTLLIHLGYLGYDCEREEAFIPNKEIVREFENAMSVGGWPEIMRILKASSILSYNDENSLSCAVGLAYYSARKDYRMVREFPTGRGFADVVFLPLPHIDRPALVVELKYDKTAQAAIQQIKDRQYTQALEGYVGDILLVGINYDKENKMHECVIERVEKNG